MPPGSLDGASPGPHRIPADPPARRRPRHPSSCRRCPRSRRPVRGPRRWSKCSSPNADVRDVLSYYERLTGKRLVPDSTIQGQINIVVNGKVTKSEAIKLIETALLLNGSSIVPGDGVTKVLG